ncbi:hypothetical protein ACLKA7_005294 [Drosophila subpalustris]
MEKARQRLHQILRQHKRASLSTTIQELKHRHCEASPHTQDLIKWTKFILCLGLVAYSLDYYHTELQGQRCALSVSRALSYVFRPPERCDFCSNIKSIPHLSDLSPAKFEADFAYSGVPIIVRDAMQNWTATTEGFQDIYEALDMPQARVMGEAPWYFGWSNCHTEVTEEFRKHYDKPYFLPNNSENKAIDWIFIGTSGMGAQMHIDNVRLPSWQAQLAGSKRWLLVPPPECYFQCRRFEVIVQQGHIIVLDTNRWYHQTFVLPGAVSITIGAEYD